MFLSGRINRLVMNTLVITGIILMLAVSVAISSYTYQTVMADRNDKPHKGNYGKCKTFGDSEGCKSTFTGKHHNDDGEPLP